MKNHLIIVFLSLLAVSCVSETNRSSSKSEPLPEVADSGIGYRTPQAALDALKKKSGTKIYQQQGWTLVKDQESEKVFSLWSFTPEGHPAHPAVVKRITYEKNGSIYLDMKVLCTAAKEPCDNLVRDFEALNERMKEDMRRRK